MVARRRVSVSRGGGGQRGQGGPLPGPRPTGGAREAWTGVVSRGGGVEIPCRAWDGWGREAGRQAAHVVRGRAGPTCLRAKRACDGVSGSGGQPAVHTCLGGARACATDFGWWVTGCGVLLELQYGLVKFPVDGK